MNMVRLIGKAILGAIFSLIVVLSVGSVMVLFIGSGDYGAWYIKPLLIIILGLAAITMAILQLQFIRGLVTWRSIWNTDEMTVIALLLPLSLLFGVWINISTGRGELGIFAVPIAMFIPIFVALALVRLILPPIVRIVERVQESLRQPYRPHSRKQPGH